MCECRVYTHTHTCAETTLKGPWCRRSSTATHSLLSAGNPRNAPGSIRLMMLFRRSLWGKEEIFSVMGISNSKQNSRDWLLISQTTETQQQKICLFQLHKCGYFPLSYSSMTVNSLFLCSGTLARQKQTSENVTIGHDNFFGTIHRQFIL